MTSIKYAPHSLIGSRFRVLANSRHSSYAVTLLNATVIVWTVIHIEECTPFCTIQFRQYIKKSRDTSQSDIQNMKTLQKNKTCSTQSCVKGNLRCRQNLRFWLGFRLFQSDEQRNMCCVACHSKKWQAQKGHPPIEFTIYIYYCLSTYHPHENGQEFTNGIFNFGSHILKIRNLRNPRAFYFIIPIFCALESIPLGQKKKTAISFKEKIMENKCYFLRICIMYNVQ